jgi:hypothetical protein
MSRSDLRSDFSVRNAGGSTFKLGGLESLPRVHVGHTHMSDSELWERLKLDVGCAASKMRECLSGCSDSIEIRYDTTGRIPTSTCIEA